MSAKLGIRLRVMLNTIVTTDACSKESNDQNFPAGWLVQSFNGVNGDRSPLNEEQSLIIWGVESAKV